MQVDSSYIIFQNTASRYGIAAVPVGQSPSYSICVPVNALYAQPLDVDDASSPEQCHHEKLINVPSIPSITVR